jgi:ABC-type transporter Mla subunit MlaD
VDASDAWRYALAAFLVLTGLGLTYMLYRLGGLLARATATIEQTMGEVLPMLGKASTTLDHVNDELGKVSHITDSAVDAADKLDSTVRTLSSVLGKPAKAASGVSAGISQAFQSFRSKRDQRGGVL